MIGFIKSPNEKKEKEQPQNVPVTKNVFDLLKNVFKFLIGRRIPIVR